MIGRFWMHLATNFHSKVSQTFSDILGNFENHQILSQTGVANFWVTFEKIG